MTSTLEDHRYDIRPLLNRFPTNKQAATTLRISGDTLSNYLTHGITATQAERLAARAGAFPYDLWPELLNDAVTDATGGPPAVAWTIAARCITCGRQLAPQRHTLTPEHGTATATCTAGHTNTITITIHEAA